MDNREGQRSLIPVELSAFGAQPTRALMTLVELSSTARFLRAARGLAAGWGLAAIAVFMPILHFVLVPTLLAGGIAAAIALGRQSRRVWDLRGPCPRCGAAQHFEAAGRVRRTRLIACPACHTNVTLVVLAGAVPEATPVEAGGRT